MTKYLSHFAFVLFLASCVLAPLQLEAHKPDESYVFLRVNKTDLDGRVELNSDDLNRILGIDLPFKGVTNDMVTPYAGRVQAYLREHLSFTVGGKNYVPQFAGIEVYNIDEESEPDAIQFPFTLPGMDALPSTFTVSYDGVMALNDEHRGFLLIENNWQAGVVNNSSVFNYVFTPGAPTTEVDLTDRSVWKGVWALIKLGVWHIWIGLDHILFIVALILPSVVRRKPGETGPFGISKWRPVAEFKPAFLYIIKIVTFFTIAHSITLALAALELVNLPSRYVESLIAFSIGLAALHNIRPIFKGREWVIAFVFGLFHGFGFASVLGEKGLGSDFLAWSLFGFNVGVEIGQLLIICAVFPVLFLLRKTKLYPKLILFGSILLIFIALYWTVERLFEVDITPIAWLRDLFGMPAPE
ncbi:MAG: HupE/UreJ family protein [Bacteroidota bacterium]